MRKVLLCLVACAISFLPFASPTHALDCSNPTWTCIDDNSGCIVCYAPGCGRTYQCFSQPDPGCPPWVCPPYADLIHQPSDHK
jgi:hypothetical protein